MGSAHEQSGWRLPVFGNMALSRQEFLRAGGAGLVGIAVGGFAGCGDGEEAGGGEYNFRLGETHPEDYPTTRADERFAELVRERSNGRINITVHANAQLGEEAAVIEQVQTGAIELTRTSSSPMAEFASSMGAFSLPHIFDSSEHMWAFLQGEGGKSLLDEMSSAGFKGLAYYDSGARSFYTRERVVQSPEDMNGLKIRVQKSDINVDFINALGASATPMDFSEVYSALQNGVIDGAENNWPSYLSTSHYEVAPNYTLDQHTRVPEVLVMNQSQWEELSEEDQQIVQEAASESVEYQREQWDKEVQQAMDEIRSVDTQITEVDDLTAWRAAVEPVIAEYREEYGDVLDQIESATPK